MQQPPWLPYWNAIPAGWGSYLLQSGLEDGFIKPLSTGGAVPEGHEVQPQAWSETLAASLRSRQIAISQQQNF